VQEEFRDLDEHERMARTALARLEAGTIRRFMDLERLAGG
jgi:F-type H+-transporting ATPase subunit epsilon